MASEVDQRLDQLEARVHQVETRVAIQQRARIGLTIQEAQTQAGDPAHREKDTMARLRQIFGRFDGPEDLAENFREHLTAADWPGRTEDKR